MKTVIVLALAAAVSAPVLAQTIPPAVIAPTVPSGKTRQIGFFTAINPDCTGAGDIDSRIIKKPLNGDVQLEPGPGFANFPATNPRSACNAKQVQGVKVIYTSKDGYIGKDNFELEFIGPTGIDNIWKYTVTVK